MMILQHHILVNGVVRLQDPAVCDLGPRSPALGEHRLYFMLTALSSTCREQILSAGLLNSSTAEADPGSPRWRFLTSPVPPVSTNLRSVHSCSPLLHSDGLKGWFQRLAPEHRSAEG